MDKESICYENKWCKIVLVGTYYILKSKSGKYNDQYCLTFEEALNKLGLSINTLKRG